jgi:hypothetical protein
LFVITLFTLLTAVAAQPLPLPSELFVLTNTGIVERYGLTTTGTAPATPEDAYVIDFGLDALGERMAYRTEDGLTIVGLSGGDGIQLEGESAGFPPYRGLGDTIAWSPAGDALAYTTLSGLRVYLENATAPIFVNLTEGIFKHLSWSPGGTFLAAQTDQDVWWIYRRDADGMSLASVIDSSIGTTWVSNNELVFAPLEGGLKLMNLDAANAQTVLLDESVEYRLPYLSQNDQLVFFARPRNANFPEGSGVLLGLSRGAPQVESLGETPVPLNGLQWAPGGEVMTLLEGGVLALFNPVNGAGYPLPVNNVVAFDWIPLRAAPIVITPTATPTLDIETQLLTLTPQPTQPPTIAPTPSLPPLGGSVEGATGLVLPAPGWFMADDTFNVAQVWQLPDDGAAPYRFTGATQNINEFAASRDGQFVAYVVDGNLWLQPLTSSQPYVIAELNGVTPITPNFSPDGTQVAYVDETAVDGGIWIAYSDASEPRQLLASRAPNADLSAQITYRRPQFSPDGSQLLVDIYTQNGVAAGLVDVETGMIEQFLDEGNDPRPITSRWLPDGRILTIRDATAGETEIEPGLYVFDGISPTSSPVQWIPLPTDAVVRDVVPLGEDAYRALLTTPTDDLIRVVDMRGFDLTPIASLEDILAPRLSADGRFVAGYDELTDDNADGIVDGALVIADLQLGGVFRLDAPPSIWGFRWGG